MDLVVDIGDPRRELLLIESPFGSEYVSSCEPGKLSKRMDGSGEPLVAPWERGLLRSNNPSLISVEI